ncbi:Alpha/Beta hydrolase protein [Echria macrotheca]|uniref:Kynurenine formamidase n=1 Tax=Echria macrotheca TaxID=438768 RepID=A0AAJ0F446_9PEZI|nr:Alpha/Beta hydrolase protein [Echria macrotheca]
MSCLTAFLFGGVERRGNDTTPSSGNMQDTSVFSTTPADKPSPSPSPSIWASRPWTPVRSEDSSAIIGWTKARVSYLDSSPLEQQTLDVYIPLPPEHSTTPPPAGTLPLLPGKWIIFIHGGAWRDPKILSSAFIPAARRLLATNPGEISGMASLNYRLSPHPDHPSSSPDDAAGRNAHHPDHIADVLSGLSFLQQLAPDMEYVLAGHSCGATLAFQVVMRKPERWGLPGMQIRLPRAVVGFNGLYDLAGFIARPDEGFEDLREAYVEFTRGAFGDDESVWRDVCPTTAADPGGWVGEWAAGGGQKVCLVQSPEDTLVPRGQLEGLWAVLEDAGKGEVVVEEREASGGHDAIWMGEGMAPVLVEVLRSLDQ